jgi:hypothetical protein
MGAHQNNAVVLAGALTLPSTEKQKKFRISRTQKLKGRSCVAGGLTSQMIDVQVLLLLL